MALVDRGRPSEFMGTLVRRLGAGEPPFKRARMLANAILKMSRLLTTTEAHCEVAQALADELGCAVRVRQALGHAFERWDGKGLPKRLKGEAIALAARVVQVADDAQTFHRAAGLDAALAMLDARAGKAHDPTLGKLMRERAPELFASLDVPSIWDAAIMAEPGTPDYIPAGEIDVALRAIGAFADLKCSYTRGHSAAVAELAAAGGERLGLDPEIVTEIRRAGYVHDVGRAGVPAGVWEKQGPLSGCRMGEGADALRLYRADPGAAPDARAPGGARRPRSRTGRRVGLPAAPPGRIAADGRAPGRLADMVQAMRTDRPH